METYINYKAFHILERENLFVTRVTLLIHSFLIVKQAQNSIQKLSMNE